MKVFNSIFPYGTTSDIPSNISALLAENKFEGLPDGVNKKTGFDMLTAAEQFISIENRWLFKYVEQSRKANTEAVNSLYQERLQKATESGRILTPEEEMLHREQAEREVLKYAPIRESVVFILFDAAAGRVLCSGSTAKKCEDALKRLRAVLGSLKTAPLGHEAASQRLAYHLANRGVRLMHNLSVPNHGKVVATDDDQKVAFDGVDLRDKVVGVVIEGMKVRAVDMRLETRAPNGDHDILATFMLHTPANGNIHLKSFDFDGSRAGVEGNEAHHYAALMLIVSDYSAKIFDGLKAFFNGATSH